MIRRRRVRMRDVVAFEGSLHIFVLRDKTAELSLQAVDLEGLLSFCCEVEI